MKKMKLSKIILLFLAGVFTIINVSAQSNATLNILTLNSGQVGLGQTVDVQVTVGNTGPTTSIGVNKVRAAISYPFAIVTALPNAQQTGLPPGWTITVNNTGIGSIVICNGSDVIPVGVQRQIFIKLQGVALGGPSTINGNLIFSNGASCTIPGTLNGDGSADNTSTSSIEVIPASGCTLSVSASGGTIACNGSTTTLTATPAGASGAVEYSLTGGAPFQAGNTFTVSAGTYIVTAREVGNPSCTATATPVTITEPTLLVAAESHTAILCFGGSSTVTVSATGGTAPYTGTGTFTQAAGTQSYTVTDANGCTSSVSVTVAAAPSQLVAAESHTAILCFGGSSTVTISATGGTAPYTGTGTFTQAAGTQSYTVTDANGCTSSVSATVAAAPSQLVAAESHTAILCFGGSSTVTISATGGTAPYTGTGTFTQAAGTQSYTVADANGCTSSVSVTVAAAPSQLVASSTIDAPILCFGGTTTVTVTATGGTPPYTGTGTFTTGGGAYSYTVTDANGCTSAATGTISEPTAISVTATVTTPITIPGGTGTITVTSIGGTGAMTYVITSGTTINTTGATSGVFTGLLAGSYVFTATDANGCTGTGSVTMNNPVAGNANATINILTLNSGLVNIGSVVDVQVTVGNTGPSFIGANKVRAQISYPFAIVTALPNADQTGLPSGWTITVNNTGTGTITICNGSDIIPANIQRQIFLKFQGTALGGPSTINGNLIFSNGASCTVPGSLNGDNTADNTSTSSIQTTSIPTPVTLTDFDAALVNCQPVLRWVTETEINSNRFEIERSDRDNYNWTKIGTVAANGNTVTRIEYNFIDNGLTVSSEEVFYRLKMIDMDGSFKYSKVLRVFINCNTVGVHVYPNPVQNGNLYVSLTGTSGYAEATLLSMTGQVIIKNRMHNGTNNMNVSGMANGIYVLNIKEANGIDKKVKVRIQN
jgi:Secretion system C-terminal sorting domain